jgi:hypothetical protein
LRNAVPVRSEKLTTDSAAVDEAFAAFPLELVRDRRVDGPEIAGADASARHESSLVRNIATEVATLNRRCCQLSEILRVIGSPTADE